MGLVDRRPVVCRNLVMGFWVPLHYLESPIAAEARPKPNQPNIFSQSDLYKSFQTDMDTQMYLG